MNITARELATSILMGLPFIPNEQQMQVAYALARFCAREEPGAWDRAFILDGYAGTGKTSLTAALVKALKASRVPVFLMAPTGRAAKIFALHAAEPARTIHRNIYRHVLPGSQAGAMLRENNDAGAIYLVDEASMIGGRNEGDAPDLLADLLHFVYARPDNRVIFLGDTAQLPPVGSEFSPAMDRDTLRDFGLKITRATLTAVARQGADSGILYNATRVRMAQEAPAGSPFRLRVSGFSDVETVEPEDLPGLLESAYYNDGAEETVLITRSNKTASQYNQAIRSMVLYREEELSAGDLLVAEKIIISGLVLIENQIL